MVGFGGGLKGAIFKLPEPLSWFVLGCARDQGGGGVRMRDPGARGTRFAVRARGRAAVAEEKGVGARAVCSWSSGLAGILFWSRRPGGRASGEAPGRETSERSCARTQGRGEGSGCRKGGG